MIIRALLLITLLQLDPNQAVHPLLPRTLPEHLVTCQSFFDYEAEFEKSKACSVKFIPGIEDLKPPTCWVVLRTSPDVYYEPKGNFYFSSFDFMLSLRWVGLYSEETIWLIDSRDIKITAQHEAAHHFLEKVGLKVGHDHPVYKSGGCFTQHYFPSKGKAGVN